MEEPRNRIAEVLGRDVLELPANNLKEAQRRLNKAMELHAEGNKDYTEDELHTLVYEINLMRDQVAWYLGYSDLRNSKDEEDYFRFITPGSGYYPEYGITKAEAKREKDNEIKKDLARYYRYSPAMKAKKRKIIRDLIRLSSKYHELFGKLGKDVYLYCDGTKVGYADVLRLDEIIERLLDENKYIEKASRIRNPYKLPHQGFTGRYKKVVVSSTARRWFNKEPLLKELMTFLSTNEDPPFFIQRGLLIYKALETIIRIVLHGRGERYIKEDGKKSIRYRASDTMINVLKTPEYIDIFKVGTLARSLIVEARTDVELDFVNTKEFVDSLDVSYFEFQDEMISIRDYYDLIKENK